MTEPESPAAPAQPIKRPTVVRWIWYGLSGSAPAANRSWVFYDVTCRTWWLRHFLRSLLYIVPLLVLYLILVPASTGLLLLTSLTFAGGALLFWAVNILIDTDRRAVRAGYPSGLASDTRARRSEDQHRTDSHARREKIAARQARRRSG